MIFLVAPDDVADGTADEEIFLNQAQLLARVRVVGGVENLCDVLGPVFFFDGADVVALIEDVEAEAFVGACAPEAEHIHGVGLEAEDRNIIRDGFEHLPVRPDRLFAAAGVGNVFDPSIDEYGHGVFRANHFPRVAQLQPVVGALPLPAVLEFLAEDSVLIAQAVSVGRQLHRCHRVEEAGRQTTQTAIAEPGFNIHLNNLAQINVQTFQSFFGRLHDV